MDKQLIRATPGKRSYEFVEVNNTNLNLFKLIFFGLNPPLIFRTSSIILGAFYFSKRILRIKCPIKSMKARTPVPAVKAI